MIVTAILGFAGSIVTQVVAHHKSVQASKDAIAIREQDRLDREQKLEEILARSAMEIDLLQARSEAMKVELARTSRRSEQSQQRIERAVDSQAAKLETSISETRETQQVARQAAQEANRVNEKIAEIGAVNTKLEQAVKQQTNRIEAKVDEVHEAVVVKEE